MLQMVNLSYMTLLNSYYVCKKLVLCLQKCCCSFFLYGMRFGHLYAVQTSERSDWANLNCNVHATPPQLKRHPSHLQASNSFLLTREMLFISNVRFIYKIWKSGLFKILSYKSFACVLHIRHFLLYNRWTYLKWWKKNVN